MAFYIARAFAARRAVLAVSLLMLSALPTFAQDYLIGSQDVLKISVFGYPDLTIDATRVSEDGKITFPLIGEIEAKNLTIRQVERSIADKLDKGNFVKNPQVNVFMQQYRGRKVTIIGEINKPGQYEISGPTTILDVISLSLGLSPTAGYELTVFRKEVSDAGAETTKKLSLDVDNLLNGGDLAQNIELQNGDVIYVPKSIFYISGEVNRPGAYKLEKGMTIKKALALAGGLGPRGLLGRIELTRKDGANQGVRDADLDSPLRVDDVVTVKQSIFYIFGEVNRPGAYTLEKGVTIKKAIALAGGLTSKGSKSRMEVSRKDGANVATRSSDIDDEVRIDDVVLIKESIF